MLASEKGYDLFRANRINVTKALTLTPLPYLAMTSMAAFLSHCMFALGYKPKRMCVCLLSRD